jgi:glucose-6-phosphate dehydrogenase assembly protein OpcA
VSASAPIAPERTEWHGEDVEIDALVARLARMRREHARHDRPHAIARTLNLLVSCGEEVAPQALEARLEAARVRDPSRAIVLREHAAPRLDAWIAIECEVCAVAGSVGSCHDTIVLAADRERLAHADSLVHALLVDGLPTVLWLPGPRPSPAEPSLAPGAQAVLLDSGAQPDPAAAVARAAGLAALATLHDLAWTRLGRWRQRVAACFDAPAALERLHGATRLEVRCGGADVLTPLLLAGWIAARAGWRLDALARREGVWQAVARRTGGAEIAVVVGGADAADGIHALRLDAPDGAVEVVEPVAEPDEARALAAALRRYDEPARGYPAALAALAKGLETA